MNILLHTWTSTTCVQRCENTWLPHVLAQVGSLVDLRMGFIAEPNASEPLGFSCMHGTSCQFQMARVNTPRDYTERVLITPRDYTKVNKYTYLHTLINCRNLLLLHLP